MQKNLFIGDFRHLYVDWSMLNRDKLRAYNFIDN